MSAGSTADVVIVGGGVIGASMDVRPFRLSRFAEGDHLVGPHEYGDRDNDADRARRVMLG